LKVLYVVRHAEAGFSSGGDDHGRALTARGELCARELGAMLTRLGQAPDEVCCSDARRAADTAAAAREAGGWSAEPGLHPGLYLAPPADLTAAARGAREDTARLLVVAHQPGLSGWIAALTGGPAPPFAPASVARVDVDLDHWGELAPGAGVLRWIVGPGEATRFTEPAG